MSESSGNDARNSVGAESNANSHTILEIKAINYSPAAAASVSCDPLHRIFHSDDSEINEDTLIKLPSSFRL